MCERALTGPAYPATGSRTLIQLITQARGEALRSLKDNPELTGQSNEASRRLCYLHERDEVLPLQQMRLDHLVAPVLGAG